jgi:hypothetical protein
MFNHFEPEVIKEIYMEKSRISLSLDGWGLKHEKISVLGVVVYFINAKYKNVTCLIRLLELPELPGHRKTGVGKCFSYDLTYTNYNNNSIQTKL